MVTLCESQIVILAIKAELQYKSNESNLSKWKINSENSRDKLSNAIFNSF